MKHIDLSPKSLLIALSIGLLSIAASCSSVGSEYSSTGDFDGVYYTPREAQHKIDSLVENFEYLDYDFDLSRRVSTSNTRLVPTYEVVCRVIAYRFFKLEAVEDGRVVVKGTPEDINVSQRAFDRMMHSVNQKNQLILQLVSEGYSRDAAVKKVHYITPESIEKVIRVLP
ncbi:MAG: hypothetical protein NC342_00010 [Pseudoflavonifractor sp.]|nr:hypothetical protein [Alloprevotella sp.]MCM1115911.1 hypothetical protein [Pseudoflavonifractor sp.]